MNKKWIIFGAVAGPVLVLLTDLQNTVASQPGLVTSLTIFESGEQTETVTSDISIPVATETQADTQTPEVDSEELAIDFYTLLNSETPQTNSLPQENKPYYSLESSDNSLVSLGDDTLSGASEYNEKPIINHEVRQQIQSQIYAWDITEGEPLSQTINFDGLFIDDDLLTYTVEVTQAALKTSLSLERVHIYGFTEDLSTPLTLTIKASDGEHESENGETLWVSTTFELPSVDAGYNEDIYSPLVGLTLYRISSATTVGQESYSYEVAYCEAIRFNNGNVYYAAGTNLTQCPSESALDKTGYYSVFEGYIEVNADLGDTGNQQTWTVRHHKMVNNQQQDLLVTISDSQADDTYLLKADRISAQNQLSPIKAGEKYYHPITYYYPTSSGEYLEGDIVLHLGTYAYEFMDADINFHINTMATNCTSLTSFYSSIALAGQSSLGLFSTTSEYRDQTFDCREYDNPDGYDFSFIDLNFPYGTELINGATYGVIGRVQPEYRHIVEDFKFNIVWNSSD